MTKEGSSSDENKIVYYGVYRGPVPGVYTSFSSVQILTAAGGTYKEFTNFDDACRFAASGKTKTLEIPKPSPSKNNTTTQQQNKNVNATSKKEKKPENSSEPSCSNDSTTTTETDMKKLAQEVALWKEKRNEFKETTLKMAFQVKTLFDDEHFTAQEAVKSESPDSLQHLTSDLLDLLHISTTLKDEPQ